VTQYDVVIVGASLAGCTAATLLGRSGARVALLERSRDIDAYKMLCTHFIQAHAVPVLERLGVVTELRQRAAVPNPAHLWTRYGWLKPVLGVHGYNVRRDVIDPILRRRAAETPGVDLMLGHTVNDLIRDGHRVVGVVAARADGSRRDCRASLVVGADGRTSGVADLAGIQPHQSPNDRCLYFAYFTDIEGSRETTSQMWLLEPEIAYSFPNSGNVHLVACMVPKSNLDRLRRAPEVFVRDLFGRCQDAPTFERAQRISPFRGISDLPNIVRLARVPGLALVGDAAIASDPLWAIGCGFALITGEALADQVSGCLDDSQALDAATARFTEWLRQEVLPHHELAARFSIARRLRPIERVLFRASMTDEALRADFERLAARLITPQRFASPRNLARALWAARPRIELQSTAGKGSQ
jgi:2-polyprenyl-6-methoxyphenol hydroxylase-like FAD-dependent oxidoreductase